MKSDVIKIDNQGNGFQNAMAEAHKAAVYRELDHQDSMLLQLITEEMLSLVRSVTGEMQASFWLEGEGSRFDLHLTTRTVMDKEKRRQLIESTTEQKNEAAKSFLGYLRDIFEAAMMADADHSDGGITEDVLGDLANHPVSDQEWDGYERSVLRKVADSVKIAIRGGVVDMTVGKSFEKTAPDGSAE